MASVITPVDKRYTDFMDEISPDELYEGLLAYDFFAEKLPPVFTAVPFFNYRQEVSIPFETGRNEYIAFRIKTAMGLLPTLTEKIILEKI